MQNIVVAGLLALAFVGLPASAQTGGVEGAMSTDGYLVKSVTMPQGSDLLFVNLDLLSAHAIVSDAQVNGEAIFDSGDVQPRTTKTMTDVAGLPAGEYGYYCIVHPGMRGVLKIT